MRRSENFVALDYVARDLWHGIIAVADDQGRMLGNPAAVRSEVWPMDDISLDEVERCINALQQQRLILVYYLENYLENKVIIQVVNWWKYQNKQWAMSSDYPAPKGWTDRVRHHGPKHKIITENWDQPGGFRDKNYLENYLENYLVDQPGQSNSDSDSDNDLNGVPAEPGHTTPNNLAGWHEKLKDSNNKPAALMEMIQTLMPDLVEQPDFGYIGKTARKVGGAGRLATLIWQASSQKVDGDLMAYCQAMAKSQAKDSEPAGFAALREFTQEDIEAIQEV